MILFKAMVRMKKWLVELVSFLCAAFMLCAVPLLFRDAFFDINRFKVEAVCRVVPILALLMGAALLFVRARGARTQRVPGQAAKGIMLLFLLSCVVSCALAGFEPAVLDGSEGRYCGLIFMICCGVAFFMIGLGRCHARLLIPVLLCAAAVALLGFANAMGLDPLGFYKRIQKGQEQIYLSTIGHFDFFGTYLVMLFPLAGSQFVFSGRKGMRWLGFFSAAAIAFGASASRTDSAFAGLQLASFLIVAISGGDYLRMVRALALWALVFAALPITCSALVYSVYQPKVSGLPGILFELHAGEVLCVLLLMLAVLCVGFARYGVRAPRRRKMAIVFFIAFAVAVAALLGAVVYFSVVNTNTNLGEAASFLRFNDNWGSLRGFAYIRALRAFADYSWPKKLFGVGMELTLRVLTPYFDDPSMLRFGVFNDPHCQPLQMLLTCGLFGMITFVAFYVSMLVTLLRHAGEDPLLCGVLSSVFAYGIVLLINVTQPILIATYFSVCALGLSALRAQRPSGGIAL